MIEASYIFMTVFLAGVMTWGVSSLVLHWRAQAWRRKLHRESRGSWKPNTRRG